MKNKSSIKHPASSIQYQASSIKHPVSKILVIDDDLVDTMAVRRDLKGEGYEIISATGGKDGLKVYENEQPILIILDIRMPGMDGIEFLEHIKLKPSDTCSIIVLTAYKDDEAIKKCLDLGISSFLMKPYNNYLFRVMVRDAIESKRMQQMVQASEVRFRSITQSAFDAIISTDAGGNIITWNNGAIRMFGYQEEEVLGKSLTVLMPERYIDGHKRGFKRLNLTDKSDVIGKKTAELHGLRKNGCEFPCELSIGTWVTNKERFYCGIIRDISERRQMEEKLHFANEEWERSFNALSQHISILDMSGAILRANKTMRESFEPVHGNIIGLDYRLLYFGTKTPDPQPPCAAVLSGAPAVSVETMLPVMKGWYRASSYPIFDNRGKQCGAISVVSDITKRKQLEDELRQHRDHLEELIEEKTKEIQMLAEFPKTSPNPFIRCTRDGEIVYINPAMERLKKEIGLEQLSNIKEILPQSQEGTADIICTRRTIINEEVYLNGKIFLLTCNIFAGRGDENAFITLHDITERKQVEEDLIEARHKAEAANLAKSTFLSNMGHELRTPLNAVMGFSEMLKVTASDKLNDKQKKYLDNIYNSGKRLLDMINDILDLSGAEAGKLELDIGEFSLSGLLNNMAAIVRSAANKKNIDIRVNVDENLPTIKGDETKLNKVVSNLLDNAVKFTPDGGEIKIEAARIADKVQISVIDTGIGINPEDIEDLFKAFEQADDSYKRKFGGAGMGLAIAKKFVEMHGGKIQAEMGEEKGSVFKFVIPLETKPPDDETIDSADRGLRWNHFLKFVEKILSLHQRIEHNFGLLCLNLEGKGIGLDYLSFTENFKNIMRKNDIFARGKIKGYFYILLFEVDNSMMKNVVKKVGRIANEKGFDANIKAVIYPEDGESVEQLMKALEHKESD